MTKRMRDALAEAAGQVVAIPAEHEIERRSRRQRRRALVLEGGAMAVVLSLLATGVLGAITLDPDSGAQQVRAIAPPTTEPAEEATTTTTAAPAPPTSAAAVPAASAAPAARAPAKPKAAAAPRPAGGGTSRTLGPRPPGSAVFAYQAGRTSWSATSNGMTMTLTIDKATPRTGELVTFTMSGSMPDRPCCNLYMVFGDGSSTSQNTDYCSYGQTRPTATSTTKQATHAYNKAGRWEFLFGGSSMTCGDNMAYGSIYGVIEVAPGSTTSQGPSQPTITVGRYGPAPHSEDPQYVTVYGKARDEDGYVSKLVVDYGDGVTEQFPGDGAGCRQSPGGWPNASMAWTPTNPPPTHQYAAPGTYKVTVTAYSQGCDGRDVQTVSGSFDHVY